MARRIRNSYGFSPAPGTDYNYGQEPEIARRLNRLGKALRLHLIGVSGHRTPEHSVAVGGFADDPHTRGQASDTPGVESVPERTLRRFGLTRPFPGTSEADHIQLFGGTTRNMKRGQSTSLADLWKQAGGPRNLAGIMAAIAEAESGGRVDAVGGPNSDGTYDYGLWQINSSHSQFDANKLVSDPTYNARAAVAVWRSQGLGAWSTYSSGAYQSYIGGGKSYAPTFGRTRPGGEASGQADGVGNAFASYIQESTGDTSGTENVGWNPLPDIAFNPLNVFKAAKDAVNGTADFLKWIAWIFHPRNVLRCVEFGAGFNLILLGIYTAVQVHKGAEETSVGRAVRRGSKELVAATPVGRGIRVARGASAGRQAARTASRRAEFNRARQQAQRGERGRQNRKRNEREMNRKYGGVPF